VKQLKDEFEYRRLVELLREIDQDRLDALAVHLDGNNMDETKLYSVTQLAELSGIPASTIRRWCAKGTIKAKRIGERKWYIGGKEVARIMEQPNDDAPDVPEA